MNSSRSSHALSSEISADASNMSSGIGYDDHIEIQKYTQGRLLNQRESIYTLIGREHSKGYLALEAKCIPWRHPYISPPFTGSGKF
jgi:hypothetical protein